MTTDRHYVKLERGTWSTVLFSGPKDDADKVAAEFNRVYQTDEYFVEPHDPAKVDSWSLGL